MRLPAEKVREAILSSDQELREAAVYYFARSHSDDSSLMSLVMQAVERYGASAFETYSFLADLVQTNDSVAWLCRQIEQLDPETDEQTGRLFAGCVAALRHAEAAVLKAHEATIASLNRLHDNSKKAIADQIFLSSLTPETLWGELGEFCDAQDQEEQTEDHDVEFGYAIADALARYPEKCSAKIVEILREQGEDWLEFLAVRIAGRLRLEEAVPSLIDLLMTDWDTWTYQEANKSLARIGTDSVVERLAGTFVAAENDLRMTIACLLENIHTDLSVQKCLDLLGQEKDPEIRGFLLQAILMNFSTEGIEPARQYVLTMPKTPELLEVRQDLLVASKMLGFSFPEFDQWTEDAKTDPEFRRAWYKDHPLMQAADSFEDDDEPSADDDQEFGDEPAETIVRHGEKVGRNDPCPCGSGKKFKKCCYGKERRVEGSDEIHSAMMSNVRHGNSPSKFPIGTVALYGPNDKTTTKIVAGVIKREGAEAILERWVGTNIRDSPKAKRQMQAFFDRHNVKNIVVSDGNMGCPHEEGQDFPHGADCPFCPLWAGKQGSNRRD